MVYMDFSSLFELENCLEKTHAFIRIVFEIHFYIKNTKFGKIGASFILSFVQIGASQNSGNSER